MQNRVFVKFPESANQHG